MGRELDRGTSPSQLDVRMVTLGLGKERHPSHEAERVAEVLERELALQQAVRVSLPAGDVRGKGRGLFFGERGRSLLARLAMLSGKLTHRTHSYDWRRERRDL